MSSIGIVSDIHLSVSEKYGKYWIEIAILLMSLARIEC